MKVIQQSSEGILSPLRLRAVLTAGVIGLIALGGCATQAPVKTVEVEKTEDLVWPAPPEQARFRYARSFRTTYEAKEEEKSSFKDLLTGDTSEKDKDRALYKPKDVHIDSRGRIFVTDATPDVLVVFDEQEDTVEFWGTEGKGELESPIALTSDKSGRIYVTDVATKRIVVFNADGSYQNAIGGKSILQRPVGIAINESNDRIYVSDANHHKIFIFDMQGTLLSELGERGGDPGQFNFPTFMEFSDDGHLYVADSMNFRIQIFSEDGEYIDSYGQVGVNVGDFNRIKGISLDSAGNLYVADSSFSNIQIFNRQWDLLFILGGVGSKPGTFTQPIGLEVDDDDNLYVVDSLNGRVQVFESVKNIESD